MKKMRKFIACASFKIHKIGIYQSVKFKVSVPYKNNLSFFRSKWENGVVIRPPPHFSIAFNFALSAITCS